MKKRLVRKAVKSILKTGSTRIKVKGKYNAVIVAAKIAYLTIETVCSYWRMQPRFAKGGVDRRGNINENELKIVR